MAEARLFSQILTSKTLVLAHNLLKLHSDSTETTPDIDIATLYIPGIWAARLRTTFPTHLLEQYKNLPLRNSSLVRSLRAALEKKKAVRSASKDYIATAMLRPFCDRHAPHAPRRGYRRRMQLGQVPT